MLNYDLEQLICSQYDMILNESDKLDNQHIDVDRNQKEYSETRKEYASKCVDAISRRLGLGYGDVKSFSENPSFKVLLNSISENEGIDACFYLAPTETMYKVVKTNIDKLCKDEKSREIAQKYNLVTLIKTTRTKMYNNVYLVTEESMVVPGDLCNKYCTSINDIVKNELERRATIELSEEEQIKLISDRTKKELWTQLKTDFGDKFKSYVVGPFNKTLVNSWYNYKQSFKARFDEQFTEKSDHQLSLWIFDGYKIFDNRRVIDGKTVSLVEQYEESQHIGKRF